jgi:hypothetical protein
MLDEREHLAAQGLKQDQRMSDALNRTIWIAISQLGPANSQMHATPCHRYKRAYLDPMGPCLRFGGRTNGVLLA